MRKLLKNLLAVAILLSGNDAYCQTNVSKYEFGINAGLTIYQGDLTPSALGSFKTKQLYLSGFASRILNPFFSLRTNLAYGRLKGDDAKYSHPDYRQQRNFNFRSPLLEISELLVWNPLGKNYDDKGLSPYLFGGIGYSFLHIKRDWSNMNTEVFNAESGVPAGLAIDAQHKLPRGLLVFPAGVGVRYPISSKLSVSGEAGYRFTNTDYLDGFSQSANPTKKDHYSIYSVGLVYRKGGMNRLKCPVMRY